MTMGREHHECWLVPPNVSGASTAAGAACGSSKDKDGVRRRAARWPAGFTAIHPSTTTTVRRSPPCPHPCAAPLITTDRPAAVGEPGRAGSAGGGSTGRAPRSPGQLPRPGLHRLSARAGGDADLPAGTHRPGSRPTVAGLPDLAVGVQRGGRRSALPAAAVAGAPALFPALVLDPWA